jgi:REP element-mobilizing transposase RayT
MTLFKDKFKIDSKRLKNWDYSSEAIYFITIVTQNRKCIFGSVEDDKMILNENGQIVENELLKSIKIRKNWFFHNWIVMPNHIHLLIEIQKNDNENIRSQFAHTHIVEAHSSASTSGTSTTNITNNIEETHIEHTHIVEAHSSASTSGTSTTNIAETNIAETHNSAPLRKQHEHKSDYVSLSRKSNSISSFVAIFKSVTTKQINGVNSIWQTNYHDHIVRNYKTFETIYNYIKSNPISWETDSINSNFQ